MPLPPWWPAGAHVARPATGIGCMQSRTHIAPGPIHTPRCAVCAPDWHAGARRVHVAHHQGRGAALHHHAGAPSLRCRGMGGRHACFGGCWLRVAWRRQVYCDHRAGLPPGSKEGEAPSIAPASHQPVPTTMPRLPACGCAGGYHGLMVERYLGLPVHAPPLFGGKWSQTPRLQPAPVQHITQHMLAFACRGLESTLQPLYRCPAVWRKT